MRIVFHGANAASFSGDFRRLVGETADIRVLPDVLSDPSDRQTYAGADAIIGVRFARDLPRPERLQLFHVPGAGYDMVDLGALPDSAVVCNCFGHEQAIAEYVLAALLARHVPLADADRKLRQADWAYWAGAPERIHEELAEKTMGLLGFGHIGKAIALRAKAFEMKVHVANRSAVPASDLVDRSFLLSDLRDFWGSVDFLVVSVPLTAETTGIVGTAAFAAIRATAVVLNVGRGPTIDERALFDALTNRRYRRGDHRHLVQLPVAGPRQRTAVGSPLPRVAESRDDAAHVGLDVRHHPPAPEDHRRQHQEASRRPTVCERRQTGAGLAPENSQPQPLCEARNQRVQVRAPSGPRVALRHVIVVGGPIGSIGRFRRVEQP